MPTEPKGWTLAWHVLLVFGPLILLLAAVHAIHIIPPPLITPVFLALVTVWLATLSVLCVTGVRHFRRAGNKIGFWVMLIVTLIVAGFAAFITVVTVLFLTGPPLTW